VRLRQELALYSHLLEAKPYMVCLNKADLVPPEVQRRLEAEGMGMLISAVTGHGLRSLVAAIARMLDEIEEEVGEDGLGKRP
jgi:GTPase involved in cell partitioning and DNA repair